LVSLIITINMYILIDNERQIMLNYKKNLIIRCIMEFVLKKNNID